MENIGKRGFLIVGIVVGIIIFAIGLLLYAQTNYAIQDLEQMEDLALITGDPYEYNLRELLMQEINNTMVGQIGAVITAICLIIASLSPITGKGTPYFSEFVRLGLMVFAAVMLFVAVTMRP